MHIFAAFGVFGGVASTVSAVNELITTSWDVPCYVQIFMTGGLSFSGGKLTSRKRGARGLLFSEY